MAEEFKLPELGENVSAGVVVNVLVAVGDAVEVDQSVLEVETDKAIAEVPSTVGGIVKEIHVKAGDEVQPGQVILTLDQQGAAAGADDSAAEAGQEAAPATPPPAAEEVQPAEPAEAPKAAEVPPVPAPPSAAPVDVAPAEPRAMVPAAPSTRRFAREIGIDISQVPGTGPHGRISIEDVKAYSRSLRSAAPSAVGVSAGVELPDFSRWGEVERQPMRGVRRVTAERLSQAWVTIPHVTHFDKADVTELERLRKQYGPRVEKAGGKLTPTAIILKVVAGALRRFPNFNVSVDMANREIIYKKHCHIGVAVDTEHGLMVPVIRDVDQKSIVDLSVELTEIAQKTRDRKLSVEDMQGGCFTISNLGGIGGTGFTPIVNAPEVAILGVARGQVEPVYDGSEFVPRMMMPLSLSYDHRVIDGADAARFLRWVAEALENPFLLSLEG